MKYSVRTIKRRIVFTKTDIDYIRNKIFNAVLIANDIETIPFKKPRKNKLGDFITDPKKSIYVLTVNAYTALYPDGTIESYCFPFQRGKSPASGAPGIIDLSYELCREINDSGIKFTGHNYVYDLIWHMRYLMPVRNWAYDSMIMFWAKYPELPKTLDFVASILLDHYQYWKAGRKSEDWVEHCEYAMTDTESTLMCTLILIDWAIEDPRMAHNFFAAHMRCVGGLSMSAKGMKVDLATIDSLNTELQKAAAESLARLRYLIADPEFNPNSVPQKKELIYVMLGAKPRNDKGRFVKLDKASTGKMPLRAIRGEHPIFRRVANGILTALEPAKQLSNVIGLQFIHSKGDGSPRFYTSYDGVGTTTTRYASRSFATGHGGNAQNIRKEYRKFMVADKDSFLIDLDYSAVDDVFVSFESQEPKKMELCRSGRDMHATNALIFFPDWTYDRIVEGKKAKPPDPRVVHPITGVRQITKKMVHGCNYLMSGLTLLMSAGREAIVAAAMELGYEDAGKWSQQTLVEFCNAQEAKFRKHYPRFARSGSESWYTDLQREVADTGGFTTIFNYFQRFMGNPHDDSITRAVAATAGQANAAGRINAVIDELLFGIRVKKFRDGPAPDIGDPARIVNHESHGIDLRLQTHDSLTFNVCYKHPNWRQGILDIMHVMNRPILCKGEIFTISIEGEASMAWAGKESVGFTKIDEVEEFLKEMGITA